MKLYLGSWSVFSPAHLQCVVPYNNFETPLLLSSIVVEDLGATKTSAYIKLSLTINEEVLII